MDVPASSPIPMPATGSGMAGRLLASPVALAVAVPLLVLVVGATFVALGQASLAISTKAAIGAHAAGLAREAARSAGGWADGATAALERIAEAVQGGRGVADLRGLVRPGAARPLRSGWALADGTVRLLPGPGRPHETPAQAQAPQSEPWYAAALDAEDAVWMPTGGSLRHPEVVVARAIRGGDGTAAGVAFLEFDLGEVVADLDAVAANAYQAPLDGPDGTAPAGGTRQAGIVLAAGDRVIAGAGEAADEAAAAGILAAAAQLDGAAAPAELDRDGRGVLVATRRIAGAQPAWRLVVQVDRDAFAGPALAHLHRSLLIGLLVLAAAVGLSVLLVRYILRQRRLAAEARAVAASAEQRLRALGSYRLLRRLGRGGMGSVWVAEHELLARPAAVKLILPGALGADAASRARACARFEREARVTATLRSRSTVTLYDYGIAADGSFYYAMELLDGLDLDRLVQLHGRQPQGRVASILIQACRSLAEAHGLGLVHRDVKPANIHLCRLGGEVDVVKVLDFGLVMEAAVGSVRGSHANTVLGTPEFMAPEQARGLAVDGRGDLYALGCVAYWLLTARLPFERDSAVELMSAHISAPPPPLPDGVDPALADLVAALMRKAPEARPAGAETVLAALRGIASRPGLGWSEDEAQAWWRAHPPRDGDEAEGAVSSLLVPVRASISGTSAQGITVLQPATPPGVPG